MMRFIRSHSKHMDTRMVNSEGRPRLRIPEAQGNRLLCLNWFSDSSFQPPSSIFSIRFSPAEEGRREDPEDAAEEGGGQLYFSRLQEAPADPVVSAAAALADSAAAPEAVAVPAGDAEEQQAHVTAVFL